MSRCVKITEKFFRSGSPPSRVVRGRVVTVFVLLKISLVFPRKSALRSSTDIHPEMMRSAVHRITRACKENGQAVEDHAEPRPGSVASGQMRVVEGPRSP